MHPSSVVSCCPLLVLWGRLGTHMCSPHYCPRVGREPRCPQFLLEPHSCPSCYSPVGDTLGACAPSTTLPVLKAIRPLFPLQSRERAQVSGYPAPTSSCLCGFEGAVAVSQVVGSLNTWVPPS